LSQAGASASDLKSAAPAAPSLLSKLLAEQAALPPGSPLAKTYDAAIKKATTPTAGTTVVLPTQEKAFERKLGDAQAESLMASKTGAEDAAQILVTNQIGRDLLSSGALTGTGAEFFVGFNNALRQAGVDFGFADAAANSQAYAAAMGANVGRIIKQFGAGTGLSDADRAYAEQMAGGKITLTEKALRRVLDINDKVARSAITRHNKKVQGIKTNVPLTVEFSEPATPAGATSIPGQSPRPAAATINQEALNWANSNPNDPRAARIKQQLGR
jgi:hypothetical protein